MSKTIGSTRLAADHTAGVKPERLISLLASWSGVCGTRCEMSAADFRQRLRLDTLCKTPLTFSQEDHAWLLDET